MECVRSFVQGLVVSVVFFAVVAHAADFDDYAPVGSFQLPGAGVGPMDVTPGGRVVAMDDDDVYVETAPGSETFVIVGALPSADLNAFGAAFIRVSPDGTRIAVGNGGGASFGDYEVGVFTFPGLTGDWFAVDNFDAGWSDNAHLMIAAGGFADGIITRLDVQSDPMSPVNPVVVTNIGGASGGVAFDAAGNLYTGNGFASDGPSGTGAVKVFASAAWTNAIVTATPIDFEASGTLVIDILSAASLGFDAKGDLFVGGGDFIGGTDIDFAALVRASAVSDAIAGMGAVDPNSATDVRRLDPDEPNVDFYSIAYNGIANEFYVRNGGDMTVHVYGIPTAVPTMSRWGAVATAQLLLIAVVIATRKSQSAAAGAVFSGGHEAQ